jgi:hypothetical protein
MFDPGLTHLWTRFCGIGVLVVAAVWAKRRHVDVGIEGEPPAFAWKGRTALVAAAVAAAFGILLVLWPQMFDG